MPPRKRKLAEAATDGGGEEGSESKPKKTRNTTNSQATQRITRRMTTDGPRQAVFKTAELIENIIVHLPAKDIYRSQRVSRQFQDIVKTSVAIHKKLLIRTSVVEKESWYPVRNLKDGPTPIWPDQYMLSKDSSGSMGPTKSLTPSTLNPLFGLVMRQRLPNSALRAFHGAESLEFRYKLPFGEVLHDLETLYGRKLAPSWKYIKLSIPGVVVPNEKEKEDMKTDGHTSKPWG